MSAIAWNELSLDEQKEIKRLNHAYRDIRLHGAGALEKIREREELQERRQAWVTENGLSCYRCKATVTDWAAGGRGKWGRLWVICMRCVRERRRGA